MYSKKSLINAFLLLLHGNYLEDILVIVVLGYLLVMFGLAQRKKILLKRQKLRRKAERLSQNQTKTPDNDDINPA